MAKREYLIYDGRACASAGTDDALCMVFSGSEKAARKDAASGSWGAVACYSYATERKDGADWLIDERWEWDWWPYTGFTDKAVKP